MLHFQDGALTWAGKLLLAASWSWAAAVGWGLSSSPHRHLWGTSCAFSQGDGSKGV